MAYEMIDNDINSRPTKPPSERTGKSASHVPIIKCVAAHILQTYKKEDYIMVDVISSIRKEGAESLK